MKQRNIENREIGAIGLGCMGMSWAYGASDANECLAVLNRALELGCNHWDTADVYGAGENEKLLANVLKEKRDQVFLASKFGNVYDRSLTSHQDLVAAEKPWIVDGHPDYVVKCAELTLQRLGVDELDLYYQHRIDPLIPVEETWGAMKTLVEQGKVRYLGISEASPATIRRANKVHKVSAIQMEYSLWTREIEEEVLGLSREIGAALVAYSPLGRGFLTGRFQTNSDLTDDDWRKSSPRFEEENLKANLEIVNRVEAIANEKGVKNSQVALAWVLAQAENILPIPGTKRLAYLEENIGADVVELSSEDLESLNGFTTAGERYAPMGMEYVNL